MQRNVPRQLLCSVCQRRLQSSLFTNSRRLISSRVPYTRASCGALVHRVHPSSTTYSRRNTSSQAQSTDIRAAKDYCAKSLQTYDAPSYTLLAFIPPTAQPAYLALRAFNLEIARIPDTVSSPALASMRYQFWRDSIEKLFNDAQSSPRHPVAVLLAHALDDLRQRSGSSAGWSRSWLQRIITAREQFGGGGADAGGSPILPSLDALERYAENTYSTLLYLTLQALPLASISVDHVASHIGKAAGIAAVLKGLPLLAFPNDTRHHSNSAALAGQQQQVAAVVGLPLDVMARAKVREEDVLRQGGAAPGLRDAVFEVATRASDHLITAREMVKNLQRGSEVGHAFEEAGDAEHQHQATKASSSTGTGDLDTAFGVLMPALATQRWLDRLQACDFDIFDAQLRRRDWKLPFAAYWAYRRRVL